MALCVASNRLNGNVLPTVLAVAVIILTGLVGLLTLYQNETLLFSRNIRLRQSRADVESAYTLYRLYPDRVLPEQLLFDSVPASKVHVRVQPWGLYELVRVSTADSLVRAARIFGADPDPQNTLYYPDNRRAVTLAGRTNLHGTLRLPQGGLMYGRIRSDFFSGEEVPPASIGPSDEAMPPAGSYIFPPWPESYSETVPDSLSCSFVRDPTTVLGIGSAEIGDCQLIGNIMLYADELRIDSTCRLEHTLIFARKITVGRGARITAQLFARDTVLVEPRAVLEVPSGIYAEKYAELGEKAVVNGYVIVCDTARHEQKLAAYRQSRTARVRGLLWVEGVAQVQGIVAGRAVLHEAVWFAPEGYYENTLYELTLLENPETVQPLWLTQDTKRRKEAACTD